MDYIGNIPPYAVLELSMLPSYVSWRERGSSFLLSQAFTSWSKNSSLLRRTFPGVASPSSEQDILCYEALVLSRTVAPNPSNLELGTLNPKLLNPEP